MKAIEFHLHALERVSADEYLDGLGIHGANVATHEVYCLKHGGRRLLIPTSVLLSCLISRLPAVGERLLTAAGLDQVATPRVADGALELSFHRKAKPTRDGKSSCVRSRFLWLTCYPSARRFWSSVYTKACDGKLGVDLPRAKAVARFLVCKRANGTLWVSRMTLHSLTPTEPPLPFAAPYAPGCFTFMEKPLASSANMRAYLAQATGKRQEDIPLGPTGWQMTDAEWGEVVARMRAIGFRCHSDIKRTIDEALFKNATGRRWKTVGTNSLSVRTTYHRWVRSGRWSALKSILQDLRATAWRPS